MRGPWPTRLRRRLGLPRASRRAIVIVVLGLLGLAYASVRLVPEFLDWLGGYGPRAYEPKDFSREPRR